jgi:hypothetical protein
MKRSPSQIAATRAERKRWEALSAEEKRAELLEEQQNVPSLKGPWIFAGVQGILVLAMLIFGNHYCRGIGLITIPMLSLYSFALLSIPGEYRKRWKQMQEDMDEDLESSGSHSSVSKTE